MNDQERSRLPSRDGLEEERVDFRNYLGAIQRSRWLIAGMVVAITGIVLVASSLLPKTYDASATVVLQEVTAGDQPTDPESVRRRLATIQTVASGAQVREEAADRVEGESPDSLGAKTTVSVDPAANVLRITTSDRDPNQAADVSNAVANSLLAVQRDLEEKRLSAAKARLTKQIDELQGRDTPDAQAQIQALRDELVRLSVRTELSGFELQIAEPADVPASPASPKPFRNTVLALFASLFLGILIALLRDQFSPRVSNARELSRLTGLPVLAGVPNARGRLRRNRGAIAAMERGSYQTLAANLQLLRPPGDPQVILVTSAVHAEGKSTVTARLGRALAEAGHRTLLISVDMRWPTLHGHFRLSPRPGLSDALELAERAGVTDHLLPATVKPVPIPSQDRDRGATLDVLTAGGSQSDPGRLLSSDSAVAFFQSIRRFDYRYILLDAPPMLGIADVFAVSRAADSALLVARLDRLTVDNVTDMHELLGRLDVDLLGAVLIGARVEGSAYYISGRRSRIEDPVVASPSGLS
ncbi:MAG TPA: hypothetical protein VEK39_13325 [Solirubrobacterales bacterium]|nr:hypothetical protein [Solirubrobacterales bacterium]